MVHHEDLDEFGADQLGGLGAGQDADQEGLLLVEEVGGRRPATSLDALRPKVAETCKLVPVRLNNVLTDLARDRHPERLGAVRIEHARAIIEHVDLEARGG